MGARGKTGSKVSTCLYIDKKVLDTAKQNVVTMSLVTVDEKGKMVIAAKLRKRYRIKKGVKILVDEDSLHDQIVLIPIPADVDPLEHFIIKGKLSIKETQRNLRRGRSPHRRPKKEA